LQWYQCPDESLQIFRTLKAIRPNAHFLALTRSVERMKELCRTAGVTDEDCTLLSLGPAAIPRYLAAADVGLLPRRQALTNRVASPVKFGEYLASGTPVILNEEIGDYSDMVRANNVGLVLPATPTRAWLPASTSALATFIDGYIAASADWRRRCEALAEQHLDWKAHVPRVVALYERILDSSSQQAIA
jgi:glycosyltransferase involved in cell wall biosynthesis